MVKKTSKSGKRQHKSALCASIALAISSLVIAQAIAEENSHKDKTTQNRKQNQRSLSSNVPSLTGYDNNPLQPAWGSSELPYRRVAASAYLDGIEALLQGPNVRYISNRVFADGAQNIFSENGVTQWAYNWGQFIDHSIGLKQTGDELEEVAFDEFDPLEHFNNSAQTLKITRTAVAQGSGTGPDNPRQQINTVSSFIDAWAVYGGTEERLEWLREGAIDSDLSNNGAHLLMTESNHLPTADLRGDAASAPMMERVGRLMAIANADAEIVVTGDIRANENIALTTVQTLFAREHNRIVDALPETLSDQQRFDIARQLVIATQQYITYNEFLPALGIQLPTATGYQVDVNPTISNEFATVGYRVHSMIHGEIEMLVDASRYDEQTLEYLHAQGIETEVVDDKMEVAVPLNVAFANPQLAATLGIDAIAAGLGGEPQYNNDEQIDNQLRSVLFQLPNPEVADPDSCLDGETLNECFLLAMDLGSIDIFRARDHGIPNYNDLREAYGLPRVSSFIEITGEGSDEFTDDGIIDISNAINDPAILDFTELRDKDGNLLELGSEGAESEATFALRRTTLAARLKAIYGDVDSVDAFVGAVSEPHVQGTEFGELQKVMWEDQFKALRDGDSNFYQWSQPLRHAMRTARQYNLSYEQSLADVIINNTELSPGDIQTDMFLTAD